MFPKRSAGRSLKVAIWTVPLHVWFQFLDFKAVFLRAILVCFQIIPPNPLSSSIQAFLLLETKISYPNSSTQLWMLALLMSQRLCSGVPGLYRDRPQHFGNLQTGLLPTASLVSHCISGLENRILGDGWVPAALTAETSPKYSLTGAAILGMHSYR